LSGIVYVVDDDAFFRAAIQQQLEQTGYRVVTYASAEEVLEQRPDENGPGCILLDRRSKAACWSSAQLFPSCLSRATPM